MARSVARLKMGYFPLPAAEARNIRSLLSFCGPCSVIDPCAGKGTALNLITAGAPVLRFGVELDTGRAEEAAKSGIRMIQGNVFDAQAKVESFSMLYLNPPYDSEINLTGNRRLERLFLEHTHHWLVQHGVLVFVIPFEQLSDCAAILSANFTRVSVFRMTDAESVRFRQIVVFGVRRNVRGSAHEESLRLKTCCRTPPHGSKPRRFCSPARTLPSAGRSRPFMGAMSACCAQRGCSMACLVKASSGTSRAGGPSKTSRSSMKRMAIRRSSAGGRNGRMNSACSM